MNLRRFRLIRRIALCMAVMPVFQLGGCDTFFGQVFGNYLNLLPAITYNAAQSTAILPLQIGLALLTGGFGSTSTGGTGGLGGSGLGGGGV